MNAPALPWLALARGVRAADQILGAISPQLVRKAPDPLTREGFEQAVRALALLLLDETEKPELEAAAGLRETLDVNWPALSEGKRAAALRAAESLIGRLASAVAPPLRAVLREEGKKLVDVVRGAAIGRYELPIAATFGRQDERIVEHAATSQSLYVTDYYGRQAMIFSERARKIVADGLENGLDRNAIGAELHTAIGAQLGRSEAYFAMVASVFAARARTWSLLSSFDEAGIDTWRFSSVIDERTCFAAGTRVLLGDGLTTPPIETIRAGDVVMSCKGIPRRVLATVRKPSRKWGTLVLEGGAPLVLTQSHGILTSKGWMRAGVLTKEDLVAIWTPTGRQATRTWWGDDRSWGMRRGRHDARTLDVAPWPHPLIDRVARFTRILSLDWIETGRSDHAYDLEVEEDAGYVAEGVVVHNSHICRFLDGRVFSVARAMKSYADVAGSDDPEAVKTLQPFVREAGGLLYTGAPPGEPGHFAIARVEESAMGRKDDRGKFSHAASDEALEAAGVSAPPLHPHCRSELIPESYAKSPSAQVPELPPLMTPGPAKPPARELAIAPPPAPPPSLPVEEVYDLPSGKKRYFFGAVLHPHSDPGKATLALESFASKLGEVPVNPKTTGLVAAAKAKVLPYEKAVASTGKSYHELVKDHGEDFSVYVDEFQKAGIRATKPTVDQKVVGSYIVKPPDAATAPVVVFKSGDALYLHDGHEAVMASHLRDISSPLSVKFIDLDRVVRPAMKPEAFAHELAQVIPDDSPDGQKRVREGVRKYLLAKYGIVGRDDRAQQPDTPTTFPSPSWGNAGRNDWAAAPSSAMAGAAGQHSFAGWIKIEEGDARKAHATFAAFGSGRGKAHVREILLDGKDAAEARLWGVNSIFHEEIHGASKIRSSGYAGVGVGVEEALTEILARRASRDFLGVKYDPEHPGFVPFEPPSRAGPSTSIYAGGASAYRGYITALFRAVGEVTGHANIHERIEAAAIGSRQWGKGERLNTGPQQAADFVRHLVDDKGKPLDADVADQLVTKICRAM